MSSEELVRSQGGPAPYNATYREVFAEKYSPLDDYELRLAPSSKPGGDPNVKRCFTEGELAMKCPTLLYEKKDPPKPVDDICKGYEVPSGDGYKDLFGDETDDGGFLPLVDNSKTEPYDFAAPPVQGTLKTQADAKLIIKGGTVTVTTLPRTSQTVTSIKLGNKEFLKSVNGVMYSTTAVNVPKGASDKLTRVDEAGNKNPAKTTSKLLTVAKDANSMFSKIQASFYLPPGSVIDGKKVATKSTLSNTTIVKRISIGSNDIVRYTTGISITSPFVNARMNIPHFALNPEFKKIVYYDKKKNAWETMTKSLEQLGTDVVSVIFSTTDHKYAMGLRLIAFPRPKTFGSTFPNSYTTRINRGTNFVSVACVLAVGKREGNPGKVLAPAGTYSVTQDLIFGTFAHVQAVLNGVYKPKNDGKCPTVCKPTPVQPSTMIVVGQITDVFDANTFRVRYTKDKKPTFAKITKKSHSFKKGEFVNLTVEKSTWKIKNVSKRPAGPPAKNQVVQGKVAKMLNRDKVNVEYTDPWTKKKVVKLVLKKDHKMNTNEQITITLDVKTKNIINISKKSTPSKPIVPANKKTILGKVLKVVSKDKLEVRYTDPITKKQIIKSFLKKDHAMKLNEMINVSYDTTLKRPTGISKIPPKKPVTPISPVNKKTIDGKVAKMINRDKVNVEYTDPWTKKKVIKPVVKKAHGMHTNNKINITLDTKTKKIVGISKKTVPKPSPNVPSNKKTILGKVTKIVSKDKLEVRYTDPITKKQITKSFLKKDHAMKLNEMINVSFDMNLKRPTGITKKSAPKKPAPKKPAPKKPAPKKSAPKKSAPKKPAPKKPVKK